MGDPPAVVPPTIGDCCSFHDVRVADVARIVRACLSTVKQGALQQSLGMHGLIDFAARNLLHRSRRLGFMGGAAETG
jgi:hypothetical protein